MSSTLTPHPDSETLLRLLDADLPHDEWQRVDGHLAGCRICQRELDGIREALGDYQMFHQAVVKPVLPDAPRPWDRLDLLAARRNQPYRRPAFEWRWRSAAAAVAAAIIAVLLITRPPAVKAAELLRRAATAELAAPPRTRAIRMRSSKHRVDRPARVASGANPSSADASEIRRLLESAGYSWEDPLSAGAFARWHDALAQKQDRVEVGEQAYVIHTSTASSPISHASLKLTPDLHAVSCTLRFGATETIEMTELQDEAPAKAAAPPAATPEVAPTIPSTPAAVPSWPAEPRDELMVLSALHRIGGDLGEPIDVRRDGPNVLVNIASLDPQRQAEVRSALSTLPIVRMQTSERESRPDAEVSRRPATQVDTANPLLTELQTAWSDGSSTAEFADQLAVNCEKIIERAHALRGLARRFPPDVTARWSAPETEVLYRMVDDHIAAMTAPRTAIDRLLKPILPAAATGAPLVGDNWQTIAEAILTDAGRLDQSVNAAGAPSQLRARKLAAAGALADLEQRLARLRTLVQP